MALILNIDTATTHASVCLAKDGDLIALRSNPSQKDHAAFIQPAIKELAEAAGIPLKQIDAVAVSNGPGSYTGLRVGLATAKGICYALEKPLILINTLEVMATASINNDNKQTIDSKIIYCPMIDARRMEVFTAAYDGSLNEVLAPCAMILNENSFGNLLSQYRVVFSGSGAEKFKNICMHDNAFFPQVKHDCSHMITISEKLYLLKSFADKAYSEPAYLKEFFTTQRKIKTD